jgi:hypothetical protein
VASKKRHSGKARAPRQGISGNPQRRAGQLAQRRQGRPDDLSLLDMAYALAGGAEPAPWWDESFRLILAAARSVAWPSRLVDLETQACQIVGDEFYERLNSGLAGLHPSQWLCALAEQAGAAMQASVAAGIDDWPQLRALLCGLALTAPPGDAESETAKLARETFPDIQDPYVTARAEAGQAAKLLADRGLSRGTGHPADGCRAAGNPLIARDAYGSRFLLVAPFSYDHESIDHWYAWDVDSCWLLTLAGAGVFESAQDALAEWQHAVGPAAGTELSPGTPETAAQLLAPCLRTGPMSDMLEGSEPRELIREYYRLRRRARILAGSAGVTAASTAPSSGDADSGPAREAFLGWYAAQHDDVPQDVADVVDLILYEWGPGAHPEEHSRYACSPHRIEMAARLIRDVYLPDHANAALGLLPEWTQWCIGQSGLTGDFAARSRAAALTEAASLVYDKAPGPAANQNEPPFRRQEEPHRRL